MNSSVGHDHIIQQKRMAPETSAKNHQQAANFKITQKEDDFGP